jgi:hypothetical protein
MSTLIGIAQDHHCTDCGVDTTATVTASYDIDVDMELACCKRVIEALIADVLELLHDDCGV